MLDFTAKFQNMKAGEEAGREAVPAILLRLQQKSKNVAAAPAAGEALPAQPRTPVAVPEGG
jgi:hypothetical protein